ncbi:MAG: type II secretion system protein, partial [Pseudolabrys sp.]
MCRQPRPKIGDKNAGFTILEVLIAIAVVATALTAIGALTGVTTRGVRALEQHVVVVETARSVPASLQPATPLSSSETAGELYGNRWRIGISPFAVGPVLPDSPWVPATVTVRVQSPSGAALTVETVRLQPKP